MVEIISPNNPMIKEIASLKIRKNRWKTGLYTAEGFKIAWEAVNGGRAVEKLIFSDNILNSEESEKLISAFNNYRECIKVPQKIFASISSMESPQGIIAILKIENNSLANLSSDGNYIFLAGLQDPGNCGTIIRSAEAFNFKGIIFGKGSVDPFNQKAVQASMGSILRTKLYFSDDDEKTLNLLKEKGFRLIATSLESNNKLSEFEFTNKDILIIGNEGKGISERILSLSDILITIPMGGEAESLNAGVAASLMMYQTSLRP